MRSLLLVPLTCLLLACGAKSDKKTDASSKAATEEGASSAKPTPAKATPGGGFVTPLLGAPDAIEPPSRDIVPGMLTSVAKSKGAKPDTVDYMLKWRPDIDLWVNKDLDVVSSLLVEYPAKDWEAVKAKWGKPTIGDEAWIGANWMAKLNGCANGPCNVMFMRSPMTFLEKTPTPPGALANLRPGMSPAQVKAATGYAISIGAGSDNGFGWDLSVDYTDEKLDELDMDIQTGSDSDWLPALTALWGAPVALGNDKVWVNAKDGWLVQFAWAGTLLRFHPMKAIASTIAKTGPDSVFALAQSLVGKPKTALATAAGYDAKKERFITLPNEFDMSGPSIDVDTDEKDVISSLNVMFLVENEADKDKIVKLLTAAWGPITKSKNENDEETQTIAVDGFKIKVEADGSSVRLTFAK